MLSIVPGLARIRRSRGLTQLQLAEKLGITAMSVSNYEAGRMSPSASRLLMLAKTLRVTVEQLQLKRP